MPIQFLVPAFLVGLAAVAIPILVHLARKQRAKVVPFPSLMFLEKVPYQAESRRQIHHWFLLLLRALAVIVIVAAFARPFFRSEEAVAGATSGPREIVLLVDRSYSMGVGDRLPDALDAAREAVRGMGPLDRASVVFFARSAVVAVRSTSDRTRLLGALDSVTVTSEATSYGPGLKLAQTILDETDLPGRELVVIGDLQRAGWTGEEGVSLPPGTVVRTVVPDSEVPVNRAVASVSLTRQRFSGRDRVTPTARITRIGGGAEERAEVILELEGRELQRVTVTLPATGAASVTFQPFTLAERHTRGAVRLAETDALAPDDVHHFVLSPGQATSVLVLDDAGSRGASSFFLTQALAISEENTFDVSVQAGGAVGASDLAGRAVVVVNDRPVPGGASAAALRSFVEGGGGLLAIMGERFTWPDELADLLPGAFTGPVDRAGGRGERLGHVDHDHPVFEIFRGPRTGDFSGARFYRAREMQITEGEAARVLARYDDGSVALAERLAGEGRVLVWTSTLDVFWNDLARQSVFLPFVHQLIRHASGRTETLAAFTAGQVIDVTDARAMATAGLGDAARALAGDEERVALTPSGRTLPLPVGEGPHFLSLEEQGVYEIRPPGASEVRPLAVAVNVELAEADLTPLDVAEVTASISAAPGTESARGGAGARAAQLRREDQERRQSLWRMLLAVAFVLLAVETVISNRISRTTGRRGIHASA
ncbi:MAG TPA: BatA and WFA domain-containing protein [Longimicrobiales bacterium]|jgi:hypothetical protein